MVALLKVGFIHFGESVVAGTANLGSLELIDTNNNAFAGYGSLYTLSRLIVRMRWDKIKEISMITFCGREGFLGMEERTLTSPKATIVRILFGLLIVSALSLLCFLRCLFSLSKLYCEAKRSCLYCTRS
jgi:hypothetical protein